MPSLDERGHRAGQERALRTVELRLALLESAARYNSSWLIERHGFFGEGTGIAQYVRSR